MTLSPIADHPALRILTDGETVLCAGDLHIGLEDEMRSKGVIVPSQTERMLQELLCLAEGCDRLVLLGDVKHQVPGTSEQEHSELPRFFSSLTRAFRDVDIVRGNHDVGIEDIGFSGVHIHPASGFSLGDVGFVHGHIWPSNAVMSRRTLVMAHNHPAILFRDGVGHITTERCWLRCRFREEAHSRYTELPEEVVVVPALNRSLQGSPVNLEGGRQIGPLFGKGMIDLENAQAYLLDGVHLGPVKSLVVKKPRRFLD
ncbi:MAG: metallophosphoesterase [Methanomassiliicoccales archaeon]|nr:metallophosphoesterase [Methanomassiliicoccales archaeon]